MQFFFFLGGAAGVLSKQVRNGRIGWRSVKGPVEDNLRATFYGKGQPTAGRGRESRNSSSSAAVRGEKRARGVERES